MGLLEMALYRIYIDEVGNHGMRLKHIHIPNERFLSLTGVILESRHILSYLQPELEALKRRFFQKDPDVPVVLHRKDLLNKNWPFEALRQPETEEEFYDTFFPLLEKWDFRVITVIIDKKAHYDQYRVWRHHPYHYCMQVLLERFVLFLIRSGGKGDAMVESRGEREDRRLKASYARLYNHGTEFVSTEQFQANLTSHELKVKPKSANIAGLQLSDLIAHPSQQAILMEKGLIAETQRPFNLAVSRLLEELKYHRHSETGEIWGYGKKLLP